MEAEEAILTLLARRGAGKTICPSEAARVMDRDNWRGRMAEVRAAAQAMARGGRLVVTQRGTAVDASAARGPVRLRLP